MLSHWRTELQRVIFIVLACVLIGMTLGNIGLTVGAGLSLYLIGVFRELRKLHAWLSKIDAEDPPPEGKGFWGEIFDAIYRRQKMDRQRYLDLANIIERARASTNAFEDAIVLVGREGLIEWYNPSATRLLGFRNDEDIGHPIHNLLRDPRFRRWFNAATPHTFLEIPSPNNSAITLQYQLTIFGDNDRLLLVRDVSRLHQLEQMRKDFVANVSHELRTPLTVVKGYLETFLSNPDTLNPRILRAMQQMDQQTHRMEALISDLLLLSRLESGQDDHPPAPVLVPSLISRIKDDALALAATSSKKIDISLDVDNTLAVLGNEKELYSALSNLVTNAVKYTPSEAETGRIGHLTIRWYRNDSGAHFAVKDNGVGIEPQHIPRLTERFYRADPSRATRTGGTGLGLAIVKHVLIRHEANLEITSQYGQGSEFICHFPNARIVSTDAGAEFKNIFQARKI
ncbi:MAG TPA: phosphate regulon sensor histidine kinase PhoR [Pseudomonadales bacterium]|nr:phosphate regulon sensor histidine kinase PhoR [Pseudomonadales bacterium]